jgi:hypothetical protein
MAVMDIKWKQLDINNFIVNLYLKSNDLENNAGDVLLEFAHQVMAESTAEIPVSTGTARDSAYIESPRKANGKVWVKMGYGGMNDKRNPDTGLMASQYVLKLHETKPTPPGGGYYHPYGTWKFFESPLRRNKKLFYQLLGIKVKALLNRGGKVTHVGGNKF